MLPNKSFNILYWSFVVALFMVYVGLKSVQIEKMPQKTQQNVIVYSQQEDFIIDDMADRLLAEYKSDERKLLVNETKSVEMLASIFENSLSRAVDSSLSRITSPDEKMIASLHRLIRMPSKIHYTNAELNDIKSNLKLIKESFSYYKVKRSRIDQRFIKQIIRKDKALSNVCNELSKYFSQKSNIRSLKDFVLHTILGTEDPYSSVGSVLSNKALEVHNKYETFLLKQELDIRTKEMDSSLQYQLSEFLKQPRWNLWAPKDLKSINGLKRMISIVGIGGAVEDVVVENRASNIVKANTILRKYIRNLESA